MKEVIERGLAEPMPRAVAPMLPREVREPFRKEGWYFELKYDGFRAIALVDRGNVRLHSRTLNDLPESFAPIRRTLREIPHQAILDGEAAVVDEEGKPQFQWIRNYSSRKPGKLAYFVFDLLYLDGTNLMSLPLHVRKAALAQLVPELPNIRIVQHVETEGELLFERVREMGLEGIVAKDSQSVYTPGTTTRRWLKVKNYVRHGWRQTVYR